MRLQVPSRQRNHALLVANTGPSQQSQQSLRRVRAHSSSRVHVWSPIVLRESEGAGATLSGGAALSGVATVVASDDGAGATDTAALAAGLAVAPLPVLDSAGAALRDVALASASAALFSVVL